eukprot:TRINITY_DN22287_c0_g1_i1.p1 TRINITY_DN22287_c0_g1~~TRINITY_DN22287_c0_g1_i1.p1  ORF type:complete len:359 (+),score=93.52 TRINITY_DN22287_c0_g1_i1:57-1133(+)
MTTGGVDFELSCPCCLEDYLSHPDKETPTPLLLACQHNLCQQCFANLHPLRGTSACPICRKPIKESMGIDRKLIRMINFIHSSKITVQKDMCLMHPDEPLKIKCLDHNLIICRDCRDYDGHIACKTMLLSKVIEQDFKTVEFEVQSLGTVKHQFEEEFKNCQTKIAHIKKFRDNVNVCLDILKGEAEDVEKVLSDVAAFTAEFESMKSNVIESKTFSLQIQAFSAKLAKFTATHSSASGPNHVDSDGHLARIAAEAKKISSTYLPKNHHGNHQEEESGSGLLEGKSMELNAAIIELVGTSVSASAASISPPSSAYSPSPASSPIPQSPTPMLMLPAPHGWINPRVSEQANGGDNRGFY